MLFRSCALLAAAATLVAAPATGQFSTQATSQTVRHIDTLPTHAERMSAELMLIAMGIDTESRLLQLRDARNGFVAVLNGLRYGDTMMEVPLLDEPEVADAVRRVNDLWPDFDDIVYRGQTGRSLSEEDVRALSQLTPTLVEAAERASDAFGSVFAGGNIPSILVGTTLQSQEQALLVQRMLRDYLMIAYGQDVDLHGEMLQDSYQRFDKVLAGLLAGDPDLRLLPAPTPEIAQRLAETERQWEVLRPFLAMASQNGRTSPEHVQRVARAGDALYRECVAVAELYAEL